MRNRARLIAAIALAWHVAAVAIVSTAIVCESTSEHAGMADCPLHESASGHPNAAAALGTPPACPLHAEKHGTHDCDCPTIGCAETDAGFMALFGAIGVLPPPSHLPAPLDAGDASPRATVSTTSLAPIPLAPPPRA